MSRSFPAAFVRLALATIALLSTKTYAQLAEERSRFGIPSDQVTAMHMAGNSLVVGIVGPTLPFLVSFDLSNPDAPAGPVPFPVTGVLHAGDDSRVLTRNNSLTLSGSAWTLAGSVAGTQSFQAQDLRGDLMIGRSNDGTSATLVHRRQSDGNWTLEQYIAGHVPVGILSGERLVCWAPGEAESKIFQRVKGIWFPTSILPTGYRAEFRIGEHLFCRDFVKGLTNWRLLTDTPSGFVYGGSVPAPPEIAPWRGLQLNNLTQFNTALSGSVLAVGCPWAGTVVANGSCGNCGAVATVPHGAVLIYVKGPDLTFDLVGVIANPDPFTPSCPCAADSFGEYVMLRDGLLVVGAVQMTPQVHVFSVAGDCDSDGVSDLEELATGASSDFNDNGIPDSCECLADLNQDSIVGGSDLAVLLAFWGPVMTFPAADIDRDGTVGAVDLALVLSAWGTCPG
jgi:hypothetical protein